MTDLEFIKKLKEVKKELVKRYKNECCEDFAIGCKNCQIQMFIGLINEEIILQEWIIKDKKLPSI